MGKHTENDEYFEKDWTPGLLTRGPLEDTNSNGENRRKRRKLRRELSEINLPLRQQKKKRGKDRRLIKEKKYMSLKPERQNVEELDRSISILEEKRNGLMKEIISLWIDKIRNLRY